MMQIIAGIASLPIGRTLCLPSLSPEVPHVRHMVDFHQLQGKKVDKLNSQ